MQSLQPDLNRCTAQAATIRLRPATDSDIASILSLERIPVFHTLVGTWPEEEHRRAMHNPDVRYFMVTTEDDEAAGFALLRGVLLPHRSLELKRFVIARPGKGLGQPALSAIMAIAFNELCAHRLWLDVFETNMRALHIYRKAGFHPDGTLREAIYRDGKYHTLLLFSMLDREYRQTLHT
ncbi:MAG: GNAT family N-acetyltransferase [Acidobacteriaceae bacterium]